MTRALTGLKIQHKQIELLIHGILGIKVKRAIEKLIVILLEIIMKLGFSLNVNFDQKLGQIVKMTRFCPNCMHTL